jgi:hypothetical protein
MNTDIRLPISFKAHPKRKRLERILGPGYLDYLIDLWLSTAQHRAEGVLKGWDDFDIAIAAGWEDDPKKFIDALLNCGFLDISTEKTYTLHNWRKHQGWCVGAEYRSNKSRILALVKNHGKEAGYRIAAEKFGIHPADYGFEIDKDSFQAECDEHAGCSADGMQSPHAPSPSPSPTPSPSPRPSLKLIPLSNDKGIVSENRRPPCPQKKIIEQYHLILPTLPKVRAWPDSSIKHLSSRWRESLERQSIEFWIEFFEYINHSDFLMGNNDRGWKASLLWIVKPTNFAKILNGNYHSDRKGLDEYRKFIEES